LLQREGKWDPDLQALKSASDTDEKLEAIFRQRRVSVLAKDASKPLLSDAYYIWI
jgi:hypothetical protein